MKRCALILFVILAVFAAHGAEAEDRVARLEERITQLERRVARLEALLSKAETAQAPQIRPGDYRSKANWRRLKLGMTKTQVKEILGDPPKQRANAVLGDYWYYPDVLGGHVQFDTSGRVEGWDEP